MTDWKKELHCFDAFIATRRDYEPFAINPGLAVDSAEAARLRSAYSYPLNVLEINRIANGQEVDSVPLLREEFWLIPLEQSLQCMQIYEDGSYAFAYGDRRVQDVSWSQYWFAFAIDGFGETLVIDMEPGPDGIMGQILKVWHDDNKVEVMTHSLCQLLKQYGREVGEGWTP